MIRTLALVGTLALAGTLAACAADTPADAPADAPASSLPDGPSATASGAVADLVALGESGVEGRVEFIGTDGAVEVRYNLRGLPGAGPFGFHVHDTGDCGADSTGVPGSAAGGHFNPLASPHGAPDSSRTMRHAGDLGNLAAAADGHAVGVAVDSLLAFEGPTSVIGKAVVVHRGRDDFATQPSGDAGARIACGVVRARGSQ